MEGFPFRGRRGRVELIGTVANAPLPADQAAAVEAAFAALGTDVPTVPPPVVEKRKPGRPRKNPLHPVALFAAVAPPAPVQRLPEPVQPADETPAPTLRRRF